MPAPADPVVGELVSTTSEQTSPTPLLARRQLAAQAVSHAPWGTVDDAVRALHDAGNPDRRRQRWHDGISATLSLLHGSPDVRLSPAGHFLLFQGREHRNQPLRWYVVHVATGAHLIQFGDPWMHDGASPAGSALNLSTQAIEDYVDAVERLPGAHGRPIDWNAGVDLATEISRWHEPSSGDNDNDRGLDTARPADRARCTAARQLHLAAVLHTVAAEPAGLTTETGQQVLLALLDKAQPRINDRSYVDLARYLSELLRELNGGRRRDRQDTRTPELRQGDSRTAEVVSLVALNVLDGQARAAVQALRDHAAWLQKGKDWYVATDRVKRLHRAARMIGELFSPVPTERERLRHVIAGDVIVVLFSGCDDMVRAAELVAQVTGPVQYTDLGLSTGDERFYIPVNVLTDGNVPRPAVLHIAPGEPLLQFNFATSFMRALQTLHVYDSAVDRWAILPADAARMPPAALARRARAASHRAADAFDQLNRTQS